MRNESRNGGDSRVGDSRGGGRGGGSGVILRVGRGGAGRNGRTDGSQLEIGGMNPRWRAGVEEDLSGLLNMDNKFVPCLAVIHQLIQVFGYNIHR